MNASDSSLHGCLKSRGRCVAFDHATEPRQHQLSDLLEIEPDETQRQNVLQQLQLHLAVQPVTGFGQGGRLT